MSSCHHGSFSITRFLPFSREQVFKAFTTLEAKASWFAGPPEWARNPHQLDFRVGGRETVSGCPEGGPIHRFEGVYDDIIPNERIVYSYHMYLDDSRMSVSLATFEFKDQAGGTQLVFTEQAVFLDGTDSIANRQAGTEGLLDNLAKALHQSNAACEILSSRVINAPREKVFSAWAEPNHLANWWGPKGFTNSFHEFNFVPGGSWRFVMHGPDDVDYPNDSEFVEINDQHKIVIHHLSEPRFYITATFSDVGENTLLDFRMTFESAITCEKVKPIVIPSNEENFDRLEAELLKMK